MFKISDRLNQYVAVVYMFISGLWVEPLNSIFIIDFYIEMFHITSLVFSVSKSLSRKNVTENL